MPKSVLAEPDALGDISANSIYLRDKIVGRSGWMTGHPGRGGRRVVRLGFGNPRRSRSRSDQIRSGPGGSAAEFTENTVRVVSVVKREFAELNALGDGSTNAIYLEDQIISRLIRATGHLGWRDRHVEALGFGNPRGGQVLGKLDRI